MQTSTPQCSAVQHITAPHSTSHHSTSQHRTAHHITAPHSTAHHSTAQHSTAQHSTPHSTAQHSADYQWHGPSNALTASPDSLSDQSAHRPCAHAACPRTAPRSKSPIRRKSGLLLRYPRRPLLRSTPPEPSLAPPCLAPSSYLAPGPRRPLP